MKVLKLSTLNTGHFYPQEIFLVLIFFRGWVDSSSIVRPERLCQCHYDTIGNRNRDLSVCSVVTQPTAPPRAPFFKGRLKSGNACYHSVQNILSSSLLSKNLKIKIYRTIILPVACRCEGSSLTLVEERRLREFENRRLRKVFGPVTEQWRRPRNEQIYDKNSSSNIIWVIKSRRMRWSGLMVRKGDRKAA
jgi:hypothetical protein